MDSPDVLEGTGEELSHELVRYPNERFRVIRLPSPTEVEPSQAETQKGTLFDLLGDYIGSVEGSGEGVAARAGELFRCDRATQRSKNVVVAR